MPQPVSAADVRGYFGITTNSGVWSDASLGSNVSAAFYFLQRRTYRQFEPQTAATKYFTTEGRAFMTLPDLRSVTSVTLNGNALVANQTYYLIPDRMNEGIYTGIQFRPFSPQQQPMRGRWYLGISDWWDRGYDLINRQGQNDSASIPNDLAITGNWGWSPYPDDFLFANKVLAGFFTKRTDATLADIEMTPEGNQREYRGFPLEVREFIMNWKLGEQVIQTG